MVTKQFARAIAVICAIVTLVACASTTESLYQQIGGEQTIEEITENFVYEIEYDPVILEYFAGSDIERFKQKLSEQLCMVTNGPCEYTGDSMSQVHGGMNITESHFNRTVDLLINAMNKAGVSHRHQNRILAELAPMRKDMLYK
ncbi:group 1 truncated hemoglobin [Alteromonas sp. ASW11-19]|uniref:Group 1 truncated hemoglobin n=1 Tax=Alteromonas salexigens TaxID=2982530 RepID=A0ABT2VLW1_9ALTE|nr:group 1 truncated hemoglobin [Alteromonas salexigens]MCU7554316.1 group 1 truncated hemoglobin [Alteromonas salexigens]